VAGIVSFRAGTHACCLLLVCLMCVPGCVRRRMTIRSNPIGASVFVDDQEVGTTPVSVDFTYYGTRKIQLIKDGYETLTVKQNFFAPWYQFPVIDFFSENVSPWEHRDEHQLDFQLTPQQILPVDRLVDRAQELRSSASQGYAVPLPNASNIPQPVAPLTILPDGGSAANAQTILPLPASSVPAGP